MFPVHLKFGKEHIGRTGITTSSSVEHFRRLSEETEQNFRSWNVESFGGRRWWRLYCLGLTKWGRAKLEHITQPQGITSFCVECFPPGPYGRRSVGLGSSSSPARVRHRERRQNAAHLGALVTAPHAGSEEAQKRYLCLGQALGQPWILCFCSSSLSACRAHHGH